MSKTNWRHGVRQNSRGRIHITVSTNIDIDAVVRSITERIRQVGNLK